LIFKRPKKFTELQSAKDENSNFKACNLRILQQPAYHWPHNDWCCQKTSFEQLNKMQVFTSTAIAT
jgi:hypothetical protein